MAAERKGKKLRRCAKHANHYKLQFGLTDRNKKRTLVRHIKANPNDRAARDTFAARGYGDPQGIHPVGAHALWLARPR